jgi:curved DNA-binding protein CbpA
MRAIHILLVLTLAIVGHAFTSTDHNLFQLREEVELTEGPGTTFYDFVGVGSSSATVDEIKKAIRKKSKALHPDKAKHHFIASRSTQKPGKKGVHVSKGPSQKEIQKFVKQATERYQRLSTVGGILSGPQRERYDHFMRHGFPTWKGTGYYYSRYRPGLGTVLVGLFIAGGGIAHYFALTISYRRQREFMEKYIRSARKQAWGDETGIVGLTTPAAALTPTEPSPEEPDSTAGLNRKQKREMERQQKKEGTKNGKTPKVPRTEKIQTSTGERRRVVAENGKILIVDSAGNVFLEEEDDEGNVDEYPLNIDEIHKPTFADTAVVRLPIWLYRKAFDPFLKDTTPVSDVSPPKTPVAELPGSSTPPAAAGMSASMISDNGFEIVDATGIEEDKNAGGGKKRRKGRK